MNYYSRSLVCLKPPSVLAYTVNLFCVLETRGLHMFSCVTKIEEFLSHLQNEHSAKQI